MKDDFTDASLSLLEREAKVGYRSSEDGGEQETMDYLEDYRRCAAASSLQALTRKPRGGQTKRRPAASSTVLDIP